ncbi:recombinase family protein [soil metagenome]
MPTPPRAVAYVRASTEMQKYSTRNQLSEIEKFAQANGIEIVNVYEDHGRSGLTLDRREALKRLLSDVLRPDRGFDEVLVYDITRWGRFQDTDQAAYYEYHCRMHGVPVIYTMDPSVNSGTPMAALMKAIQRVSAADYSRTLSLKVVAGQTRLARENFVVGSAAPFGYRRQVVDSSGNPVVVLQRGQRKAIQDCHVKLIHGPKEEVAWAQRIFERYAGTTSSLADLVIELRNEGVVAHTGEPFTPEVIRHMLTNPIYVGQHVWGKTQKRLKGPTIKVPESEWILRPEYSEPMISEALFSRCARKILRRSGFIRSDDTLIAQLHAALTQNPALLPAQFGDVGLANCHIYSRQFGSTASAYELAGFKKSSGIGYAQRTHTATLTRSFQKAICLMLQNRGMQTERAPGRGCFITVNGSWRLQLQVLPLVSRNTALFWRLNRDGPWAPFHFMVIARIADEDSFLDYFIVPSENLPSMPHRLEFRNSAEVDRFRFNSIAELAALVP